MRELLVLPGQAQGAGGSPRAGSLKPLLDLHEHPEARDIYQEGNIDDDYEVEKEPIARGKFAAVRRARHRATGQTYAAKYVKRRRRNISQESEARHEITVLLLGLHDPSIIRLHQLYETRSEYIILLEFATGGDLQQLLDDHDSLPEPEVRSLLQQVLRGLSFLHQNHIAHLDIKPQNLVMMGNSPDAGIKLVDFGLSRVITQGAELTQIMGTPDYVAPEVIDFNPISYATDMWAIGVLTYVFLSGVTPFGGDTDQETFVNIIKAEYEFPDEYFDHVSDYAKDFISGLLVKKPSDRMTVDDCLNHPWMSADLSVSFNHRNNNLESSSINFDEDYEDNTYNQTFTNENDLYSLPETENHDSAYFSDSNNYGNLVIPPLYHCSIPEEQNLQQNHHPRLTKSKSHHTSLQSLTLPTRQNRNRGSRLSVDMEDSLRTLHNNNNHSQQQRAVRRASIDPSYFHHPSQTIQDTRPLHGNSQPIQSTHNDTTRPIEEVVPTRDSDVDSGVSCHDCEDSRVEASRLCHSDSYDGDAASVVSWDDYADLGGRRPSLTNIDAATLNSIAKPWEKLCTGSVSRAITQLTVKNVPKKCETTECQTNELIPNELIQNELIPVDFNSIPVDCNGEIQILNDNLISTNTDMRSSKSDLRTTNCELRLSTCDLRASKSDLRASKSDLRASKSDLRASKSELRASKADLRASRQDLRASKSELRASKSDLRASKSDLRASKSDLRASKSDLRASKGDLRGSRIDLRGSRANLTLSRLDLAHETLDDEHSLQREAEDVFRGDFTLPRRRKMDHTALAPFMRGNSLHMSFRMPKKKDMKI